MAEAWIGCRLGGKISGGPHSQCRTCAHPLASRKAWRGDCRLCPVPALLALIPTATTLLQDESGFLDQTPQKQAHNLAALERARNEARAAVEKAKGTPDAKA